MKTRRYFLCRFVLIVLLLIGGIGPWLRAQSRQYERNRQLIDARKHGDTKSVAAGSKSPSRKATASLSLTMKIEGYFRVGKAAWNLSVDAKSKAHLTIYNSPQDKTRTFQVSAAQVAQLRKALAQEHFFDLGAEYGSQMADGSTRTLTIREGKRTKSVTMYSLSENGSKLSEVKRALRVWNVARPWFHDAEAVDSQAYDQRILNVYEGPTN